MPASQMACSKGSPCFVHLLDEIEEHDDVADDHADQAGDSEEGHEAEGRAHDGEREQRADHAIGGRGEDQQRLDGVVELQQQRGVDSEHGDEQHLGEVRETVLLLGLFAADAACDSRAGDCARSRSSCGVASFNTSEGRTPGCG